MIEIDRRGMFHAIGLPTALDRRARPRRVDENPAHDAGAHREEMCAIGPIQISTVDQAQIRLVHECGRLQSVTGALVPHVAARHAVQLVVDERREAIKGRRISAPPRLQQTGDFSRLSGNRHRRVL